MTVAAPVQRPVQYPASGLRRAMQAGAIPEPAYLWDWQRGEGLGRWAHTRASAVLALGPDGLLRTVASGVPAYEWSPAGALLGLRREPARTNMFLYSPGPYDVAPWSPGNLSIGVSPYTAPDGSDDAVKLVEASDTSQVHQITQSVSVVSGTMYTLTHYFRAVERTRVRLLLASTGFGTVTGLYDLAAGTASIVAPGTGTVVGITALRDGWYRCRLTTQATGTGAGVAYIRLDNGTSGTYSGDGSSGVALWAPQLEAAHCETSYIATGAATVTRAVDDFLLSGTAFSEAWSATEGSILVEFSMPLAPPASSFPVILSANDATANERVSMTITETTGALNFGLTDGGVVQATCAIASAAAYDGTPMRLAAGWRLNDVRSASAAGTLATQDTSATLPTVTQLQLGNQAGGSAPVTPMHFRRLAYWPRRLTDQQLRTLAMAA